MHSYKQNRLNKKLLGICELLLQVVDLLVIDKYCQKALQQDDKQ